MKKETSGTITKTDLIKVVDNAIAKLAGMLAVGFAEVHAKFDGVENRLNHLESRFDSFQEKIDVVRSTMVTKKDLLQMHDNFVSKNEFNGLDARVSLIEETIYE
ncbi:MAG: hypothetical protein JWL92_391 [Candidatus Nomurabacteria bacterium]|nr:hypothetical protein [Candidatus Nomurabacteria bacterium]